MAGVTGLEPAASGVTGQRSNQLSYTPKRIRHFHHFEQALWPWNMVVSVGMAALSRCDLEKSRL